MKLNENECYILPLQQQQNSEHHFKLNSKFLESKNEQKYLGVMMSIKHSWKANSQKRCQEAAKAFYFLKPNNSIFANFKTKINAYVGWDMSYQL